MTGHVYLDMLEKRLMLQLSDEVEQEFVYEQGLRTLVYGFQRVHKWTRSGSMD